MTEYYNYVMFSIMISKNGTPKTSLTPALETRLRHCAYAYSTTFAGN